MRVGVITQSPSTADILRLVVGQDPALELAWVATTAGEAVDAAARTAADLILLDVTLAALDAADTTRRIMAVRPCAILLVATSVKANASRIFEAMGHGALDAIDTPALTGGNLREIASPLHAKIEEMAPLIAGRRNGSRGAGRLARAARAQLGRLVVVGASAGGPAVLATMLRDLPKEFPAAMVIVQHVDEQFAAGMAEWLARDSTLTVRLAREGDRPTPGEVLLAATKDHLALKSANCLGYTVEPRDQIYRPSVDVFFQSVSRLWQGVAVGVLLTGMGRDGALGLKALRDRGHHTIAQDEATSAVYGMPKAAATLNAATDILAADRIASRLIEVLA